MHIAPVFKEIFAQFAHFAPVFKKKANCVVSFLFSVKIPLLPFRELFPISIWIEKRRRLFNPFAKLDFVSGVNFYVTAHFFRLQCKVLRYCSFILSREHRSTGLGGGFAEVTIFFKWLTYLIIEIA